MEDKHPNPNKFLTFDSRVFMMIMVPREGSFDRVDDDDSCSETYEYAHGMSLFLERFLLVGLKMMVHVVVS